MRRKLLLVTLPAIVALTLLACMLLAQGRGPGQGRGMGAGMGAGRTGMCRMSGTAMANNGGWWNRVSPQTAEQRSLVEKVTNLHERVRTTNLEISLLKAQNALPATISDKQNELLGLRADLLKVTDSPLLQQMGVPAGCGMCDGTGPQGRGLPACPNSGLGSGNLPCNRVNCIGNGTGGPGRGNGMRLRDGSGPNANCPLKR